jgi:hypothetical protein
LVDGRVDGRGGREWEVIAGLDARWALLVGG